MRGGSRSKERPRVLLINGMGDWAGVLRLPWILRRAGAHVTALTPLCSRLGRSWHLDVVVNSPVEKSAFVDFAYGYIDRRAEDFAWVLAANEPTLVAMARDERIERAGSWFCVSAQEQIERITNKAALMRACDEASVAVPRSRQCATLESAKVAAMAVGYPLILKPCSGWAGDGVHRVESLPQLVGCWQALRRKLPVVVQELIVGEVGMTHALLDHGNPLAWYSGYKRQCWPEPFGPSSVREIMDDPQIEPMLRGVGNVTGFHGLCSVEWIRRGRDGAILVIEFNPRPTPSLNIARRAGVDFSSAIGAMLRGEPFVQRPRPVGWPRSLVYQFPNEATRSLMLQDFSQAWRWLPGMAGHDVNWSEPGMLLGDLRMVAKQAKALVLGQLRHRREVLRSAIKARVVAGPIISRRAAA